MEQVHAIAAARASIVPYVGPARRHFGPRGGTRDTREGLFPAGLLVRRG
jgi:hypothetical protein